MCSVYVTNLKKFPPFIPEILGAQDGLTYGWTMRKGYRRRMGIEKDTSSLLSTCLKGSLDLTSIHLKTKRMKFITFQELLEVVHKKLSERRPFGSLQSVDELLNFGRNSAADWNTCRGRTHVKSNTKLLLSLSQVPTREKLCGFL